jgi:hypothetical protein
MMHCEGLLRQEVSRLGSDTAAKVDSLRECRLKQFLRCGSARGSECGPRRLFKNVPMSRLIPVPFKLRCSIHLLFVFFFDAAGILFESSIQWVSKWVTTTWPTV